MVTNTLQTIIDYVKDLTGQTNASDEKIIRAVNFGVDNLAFLSLTAAGRFKPDSRNHGDVNRVITTVTSGTTKLLLESELVTISQMDIEVGGVWRRLEPTDRSESRDTPLDTSNATGTPTSYDVEGNHAYLYPVPNATFRVRLSFGRAHPRFTVADLASELGINPLHEEYVAFFAADRILIGTSDASRVQVRNELASLRADVIELFKSQDQDTVRRLKPKLNTAFSSRKHQ